MNQKSNHKTYLIPKNKEYFEELYREYYSSLVKFSEGILFDTEEAMDVVQEVFLEIWKKEEALQIESTVKTYLYSCVKYRAFSRLRKLNIIDKHQDQVKEAYLYALDQEALPDEELKKRIRDLINTFPSQMKSVIEFHSFYGWKYQEIAEELNISINTVKTHVKRAYKRFREEFNSEYLPLVMIWYIIDQYLS
nr:RNA polymerase sigma-70 factor [uncultured Marinifilum sp.]